MHNPDNLLNLYKAPKQIALGHPILKKCCPNEWLTMDFDFAQPVQADGFKRPPCAYLLYGIVVNSCLQAYGLDKNNLVILDKYKKPAAGDMIVIKGARGISVQKIMKQGSMRYAKALRARETDLGCLWRENFIGVIIKVIKGEIIK